MQSHQGNLATCGFLCSLKTRCQRCLLGKSIFSWFPSATNGENMHYFKEKYYHIACSWDLSRRNTTKMLYFSIQTEFFLNIYQHSSYGQYIVILEMVIQKSMEFLYLVEGAVGMNVRSKFIGKILGNIALIYKARNILLKRIAT